MWKQWQPQNARFEAFEIGNLADERSQIQPQLGSANDHIVDRWPNFEDGAVEDDVFQWLMNDKAFLGLTDGGLQGNSGVVKQSGDRSTSQTKPLAYETRKVSFDLGLEGLNGSEAEILSDFEVPLPLDDFDWAEDILLPNRKDGNRKQTSSFFPHSSSSSYNFGVESNVSIQGANYTNVSSVAQPFVPKAALVSQAPGDLEGNHCLQGVQFDTSEIVDADVAGFGRDDFSRNPLISQIVKVKTEPIISNVATRFHGSSLNYADSSDFDQPHTKIRPKRKKDTMSSSFDITNESSDSKSLSNDEIYRRERNREAVRKCRKRKREFETQLEERKTFLILENQRLHAQVKLENQSVNDDVGADLNDLVGRIREHLSASIDSKMSKQKLSDAISSYLSAHRKHVRDCAEVVEHLMSRLVMHGQPAHVSKMYVWQVGQDKSYYKKKGGLFEDLQSHLNLTKVQRRALVSKRGTASTVSGSLTAALKKLGRVRSLAMTKKQLHWENRFLEMLENVLDRDQLAKFIVKIYDIYDSEFNSKRWEAYLSNFEAELAQEELSQCDGWTRHIPGSLSHDFREVFSPKSKRFDNKSTEIKLAIDQLKKFNEGSERLPGTDEILHQRHKSALLLKELFERSEDCMVNLASVVVANNVRLYDPNVGRPIHGIEKALRYIRLIRRSFRNVEIKEQSFLTRKNVAKGEWIFSADYFGSLFSSSNETTSSKARKGKHLRFKITLALKFAPNCAIIEQLIVAWAALEIMRQLSILPPKPENLPGHETSPNIPSLES